MSLFPASGGGGEAINDATKLLPSAKYIYPTLDAGTSYTTSDWNTYYYKIGTRVCVVFAVGGLTAGTATIIFTLPSGYRPRHKSCTAFYGGSSATKAGIVNITPDGGVSINSPTTSAYGSIMFDAYA